MFVLPFISEAAGLVPCGGPGEPVCDDVCYIGVLIKNIYDWVAGIGAIIVVLIIIYAGLRMVVSGGNTSAVGTTRKLVSTAVIGYIILLCGWFVVDTGLKALLADDQTAFGVWNDFTCSS